MGHTALANAANATALGQGANASADGSVALGRGSVADRINTVSVGAAGNLRVVTNVGAGDLSAGSTDAVTGGQLFATNGLLFALDGRVILAEDALLDLDGRVTVSEADIDVLQGQIGAGAIGLVQQDATSLNIGVASATGGTVVDFAGTGGARRLSGVLDGSLAAGSAEAVTGGQLFTTNQAVGALDTRVTSAEGGIAALQGLIGAGTVGLVQQDAATQAITVAAASGGDQIDVSGTAGRRRLAGVAAGEVSATSDEATTGAQLFAARQLTAATGANAAAAFGGGASYDAATGVFSAPNYVVLGSSYSNVGGAIGALNTRVETNSADINTLRTSSGGGGAAEIAALQAQLAALQGQIAAQQALIAPLQAELTRIASGNVGGGSATAPGSTAVGAGAVASQEGATAIGAGARATGDPTTAVGYMAQASGRHGTAIGGNASATGDLSTALGQAAIASGAGSLAMGQGAAASQSGAIAIGQGVSTTRANQVAIGGTGATYTLAGLPSQASRDAQVGQTFVVTSDASGNLATMDLNPMFGRLDVLEDRVDDLDAQWLVSEETFDRHADGVAMALALGGAQVLQSGQTFSVSGNLGHFDGNTAFGFGAIGKVNDNVFVNIGVGSGFKTGVVAGRAGVSIGW